MKKVFYLSTFFLLLVGNSKLFAQSLPVDMEVFNEYYRRAQLLGNIDPNISFVNRPLFPLKSVHCDIFDPDSTLMKNSFLNFRGKLNFANNKGIIQLLPLNWLNQYNSHHPEGVNDGAMIPARGYQTKLSLGLYFKLGPLSIQFRPEFVYAQNLNFDGFPANTTDELGVTFPDSPYYNNNIDLPEQFGIEDYQKAFWGQSNIRLTFGPVSLGLSNENLWWGPGYRNSLLMTNSAPGFMHFTLNTVRPIKTFLGSFEGQIIGGKLEGSGYTENLPDDWRYINAMELSYQPKWIPGLFLGLTRSFLVYSEDMGNSLGDYLPVFIPLNKKAGGTNEEVNEKRQNQLISIFVRWLFVKSHGEIYFEYGREDHSWDARDLIIEFSHSNAYILGFRKLFSINKTKQSFIQLILEITKLSSNQTTINRNDNQIAENWYTHSFVKHGYTNNGQIIGAGIGPGSNLQTLDLSWVKSLKQIGIRLERYVHNNDFWYNYIQDIRSNWVDLSTTFYVNWDYKNFLFYLKIKYIACKNYQWLYEPDTNSQEDYWMPAKDTYNFHAQWGITYRF